MTEDRKRVWDLVLGIAAPMLTVAGLLVGVWQFNRGEENKARLESNLLRDRDNLEYRRKLLDQRLSVYHNVVDLAGRIAAHEARDKKLGELTESFMTQYWGLMILVEAKDVEKAMINFHDEILDYQQQHSDSDRLRIRADQLVKACRNSLERERSAGDL
jgi:hypothetical protein